MTRRLAMRDTEALVEKILDERLETFLDWREAFSEDPSDEPVHEVRVATRRLFAALILFRPLLELTDEVRPAALRRVEQRFGKLRDLDVLGDRLQAALPGGGSAEERAVVPRLEAAIDAARTEAFRQARAAMERKRLRRLTGGLRAWLEHQAWTPVAELPLTLLAPDLLLPFLSRALLQPGWQVAVPPAPDSPAAAPLHALRRRLKELRYAVECLAEWYGTGAEEWLNELHAIQDALGAWHDEGLLVEWLREMEGTSAMQAESHARALSALSPWPAWRSRYLDPEVRSGFRRLLGGHTPTASGAMPQATG